jgi:hypothetical protein
MFFFSDEKVLILFDSNKRRRKKNILQINIRIVMMNNILYNHSKSVCFVVNTKNSIKDDWD